ncbi:MAG: site-2 protease family protein [Candidatus Gottesmanbacteria bacterium]
MILTLIVFLLVLSLLVLVHELGHFLVAKKSGIKIEEFGFGLPPRIIGFTRGETVYSINWLPIGGFVKLYGEDEAEDSSVKTSASQGAFFTKSKTIRAAVLLAGVLMNTIMAAMIFYLFLFISNFKTEVPLFFNHKFFAVNQTNKTELVIINVAPNSPATKAKIIIPSQIISVANKQPKTSELFTEIINENKGKEITLELRNLNNFQNYKVKVTPRVSPPKNEGPLGVAFSPSQTAVLSYNSGAEKLFSGFTYSLNMLDYNMEVIGKLIALSFKEKTAGPVGEAVSGPAGIFVVFQQLVKIPDFKEKILQGLNLVGLISISLAFFNILPFPALDGGRLFFIVLEAIMGRRVKPSIERWAHQIGMAILLALIILITINDLMRIFR